MLKKSGKMLEEEIEKMQSYKRSQKRNQKC
jgi:hypothetical protein